MVRKVVLLPTYEQALSYRKKNAHAQPAGLFGVSVETPLSWLRDAWERFGDGRKLVTSMERAFALRQVLVEAHKNNPSFPLPISDGTLSLVSRVASELIGLDETTTTNSLSDREQAVISVLESYQVLLSSRNLVEPGGALAILSEKELPFEFECIGHHQFTLPFKRFLQKRHVAFDQEKTQITKAPESVDLRFLIAAGPSAFEALIARYLQDAFVSCCAQTDNNSDVDIAHAEVSGESVSQGGVQHREDSYSVLVVSHSARSLFNTCSQVLPERGVTCTLWERKKFCETDLGRAFSALSMFLHDEHHNTRALMDYVNSPFSGTNALRVAQVDSAIRSDRLLTYEGAHALVQLMSPHFEVFEELLEDSDASLLLEYLEDVAAGIEQKDSAYRSEQGSALAALRSVYETARSWSVSPKDFNFALEGLTIDTSRQINASTCSFARSVVFATPDKCLPGEVQNFDEVIICDLDSQSHSASERHDAFTTLLEKLGLDYEVSHLDTERRWFENLKSCAKRRFVCERALDFGGDEDLYPSFLWDEFVACYRLTDEEAGDFDLSASLQDTVLVRGEEWFAANAAADAVEPSTLALDSASRARLSQPYDSLVVPTRLGSMGAESIILSPSAIETYINCPYSWFVSYCLKPQSLDEDLGPLEQGTFVHGVFDAFYAAVPERVGMNRVTPENLSQAQTLLEEVFDRELQLQVELESMRYVPLTSVERAETEKLKQLLKRNLGLQARMMPRFVPTYREKEITVKDNVTYAGVLIHGRVDRIDVDANTGQFVVIDYKGSIAGHDAGFKPDESFDAPTSLPHKIQTLVYAQVLRKLLPERPVGALYLSYRAQESRVLLAGSYDESFLALDGFAKKASLVALNFGTYLDSIEELVAQRLDQMKQGRIEQKPLCPDSCKYCPVTSCARRLS